MRKNDDVSYAREYLEDFPFFQLFPSLSPPDTQKIRKKRPEECVNPLFVSKDSLFQAGGTEKSQYLREFPRLSLMKRRFWVCPRKSLLLTQNRQKTSQNAPFLKPLFFDFHWHYSSTLFDIHGSGFMSFWLYNVENIVLSTKSSASTQPMYSELASLMPSCLVTNKPLFGWSITFRKWYRIISHYITLSEDDANTDGYWIGVISDRCNRPIKPLMYKY